MEANLGELLRTEVRIERAEVRIAQGLDVMSPVYQIVPETWRGLVQPLSGGIREGLLGKLTEATHIVYLDPAATVWPGDALVCDNTRYEALEVQDEGGQGHHWRIVARKL